jgi:hypothetical protein
MFRLFLLDLNIKLILLIYEKKVCERKHVSTVDKNKNVRNEAGDHYNLFVLLFTVLLLAQELV